MSGGKRPLDEFDLEKAKRHRNLSEPTDDTHEGLIRRVKRAETENVLLWDKVAELEVLLLLPFLLLVQPNQFPAPFKRELAKASKDLEDKEALGTAVRILGEVCFAVDRHVSKLAGKLSTTL